jgi:signal transduction histidine kinase
LVSLFFVFMISDFYNERLRAEEHRSMNLILRRQTKALRQAKSELEEKANQLLSASKYKSEFIANMSHELRTPLNSILLLSQMIRENEYGNYKEQDISYADVIHKSGNELLRIINDVLDLSKVEAGKMDILFDLAAIEDLIHLMRYELEPMAQEKGLSIEVYSANDVPASIVTDVFRLRQILRNLLMNAIKFTEQGKIGIKVEVSNGVDADKQQSPYIVFTVYDTGIGISEDQKKLVFEAFHQEDGAFNRKFGGTGLGLSISIQLAKLLGGTITLQSTKGEGSRFSLHLPIQPLQGQIQGEVQNEPVRAEKQAIC